MLLGDDVTAQTEAGSTLAELEFGCFSPHVSMSFHQVLQLLPSPKTCTVG